MSASFILTRGDTAPQLLATLRDAEESPVDIAGADVVFEMAEPRGHESVITGPATIVDADTGQVRYTWDDADTDDPGRYRAQFVVEYPGGTTESFPSDGFHDVVIY
jgi:hypothetical protein